MSIKTAIAEAGGAAAVARHFSINPISVYEWASRDRLPAERIIPLAELTGWKFTPHLLDPALYPNEFDGIPDAVRDAFTATDRRDLRERRAYAERRAAERLAAAKPKAP